MSPQRMGRMRYLLLTIIPPTAAMEAVLLLMQNGLIPQSKVLGLTSVCGSMAAMLVLGYFLIFRKNHTLTFDPTGVQEVSWRRQETRHSLLDIRSCRRNFLGEYILLDGEGKRVFCVEPNMTNRDRFELWLESHHIESKVKE